MRALDHYHAYLVATKREDKAYNDLADRLQRRPPEQETTKAEQPKKSLVLLSVQSCHPTITRQWNRLLDPRFTWMK
jgi:hypothetical protein